MARIVYAASGDGYGHAVRAHSVASGLLARGHDVQFLTSHKAETYLRGFFPGRVHRVFGLMTVYTEGKAEPLKTVLHNLRRARLDLMASNRAVRRLYHDFRPDLVITDFEPFAARRARAAGIPYISRDNQHVLTHCRLEHPPGFVRDFTTAYLTIRLYYAGARRYLIATFVDLPIRCQPAALVDPILRPGVYEKPARHERFLLAYKGAGGENEGLRRELEKFDRIPIRAYGFGPEARSAGHVTYKKINSDEFLDDLAGCTAVVASAGHSLVCECLHFKKPMLLVPVAQQYEQILNASLVEKIGAGCWVRRLTGDALEDFLPRLDHYRAAMTGLRTARIESVLDAIEREIP